MAPTACQRVALAAGILLLVGNCAQQQSTHFESPEARLRWLWEAYTRNYMHPAGYVSDPLRTGHVTSEAQSYALLQSVWLADRRTFDRVWRWTRAHLRRPDGLHSWLWDPERGRVVDANSATDADVDIAFALSIASVTFDDRRYAAEARAIVQAIRRESTLAVDGGWVPSAGNWAAPERVTNLSYFAPYAYDYFDRLDGDAGWARAVEIGYDLLDRALATPGQRLPADFFRVDEDGSIRDLPRHSTLPATFSFDGIRIPWRIDLDCQLLARHRACTSDRIARTLHEAYRRHGGLITDYDRDGSPRSSAESLSFYGALLPAFSRFAPGTARTIRSGRLSDDALRELGAARDRYYDANWVWFGFAAADGFIKARTPSPSRLSQLNEP